MSARGKRAAALPTPAGTPASAAVAAQPAPPPTLPHVKRWPELCFVARGVAGCAAHSGCAIDHMRDCAACCDLMVAAIGAFAVLMVEAKYARLEHPTTPQICVDAAGVVSLGVPRLAREFRWSFMPVVVGLGALAPFVMAAMFDKKGRSAL